jgi:phosphohistidine phosphatase
MGLTAALLLSGQAAGWSVRKGAIYWIAYRDSETILRAALPPELL